MVLIKVYIIVVVVVRRKRNTKEYKGKPSSSRPFGPFKAAWLLLLSIYREERQDSTGEGMRGRSYRKPSGLRALV